MHVRRLERHELLDALHLVWDVFAECTAPLYPPEGVKEFQAFIKLANIQEQFDAGTLLFWGAFEGQELRGVGAMKNDGHICLLDVYPLYHKQGIGRALFAAMEAHCTQELGILRMTVNAAPNAAAAYQHFGFQAIAAEQTENGIRFVPMEYRISPANVRPAQPKKSHIWLIVGIVSAVLILGTIAMALIAARVSNVVKERTTQYKDPWNTDITPREEDPFQEDPFQENPFQEEPGDSAGSEPDTAENSGIESIKAYEALNLSYSVEEKSYLKSETAQTRVVEFNVKYPQIKGLDKAQADKVNKILEDCAMEVTNEIYLNPSEDMKEFLLEQETPYLASYVDYKVTYMSEDIISVVFQDYNFKGAVAAEYADLRTRTINLKDGTVYEISDIVELNDDFMKEWMVHMKAEAGSDAVVLNKVSLDQFKKILQGEKLENRYASAFFLNDGGLEIGLTYHYGDDKNISRGWITAPFTTKEILPYKKSSTLWNVVESNN